MNVPGWLKHKRLGVLYGGWSDEAEISRKTGKAVLKALQGIGLNASGIEVTKNLPQDLFRKKIKFCFIALHGKFGEDGTVQGLCEMMGIPYSGSGVLASALSMHKALAKEILEANGVPTAKFQIVSGASEKIKLKLPVVIKPVDGGSAIGVTIVRKASQIKAAVRLALKHSSQALIEEFVAGREVTAPILGEEVLPLIEIVPKRAFYDFKAKYVQGLSDHILPARVSKKTENQIKNLSLQCHKILGCRAFSRSDFIVDKKGKPWFLELNSIPGMTETSLFPESAKAAGYSFAEMLIEIMKHSKPALGRPNAGLKAKEGAG